MEIIIDTREKLLINNIENLKHPYKINNLDIGDILITNTAQNSLILIERKTLDDYSSSITDGRLKNQLIRYLSYREQHPNVKILYVIEGNIYNYSKSYKFMNGISIDTIHSSLIGKIINNNIYLYFTNDIIDTIYFINKLYDKFSKSESSQSSQLEPTKEYLKTMYRINRYSVHKFI